jgi:hypothetical protein
VDFESVRVEIADLAADELGDRVLRWATVVSRHGL